MIENLFRLYRCCFLLLNVQAGQPSRNRHYDISREACGSRSLWPGRGKFDSNAFEFYPEDKAINLDLFNSIEKRNKFST